MRKTNRIDRAVTAGLEYIADRQLSSGGFKSYSSPSATPFTPRITYQTTFTPSLILSALAGTGRPGTYNVCRKTAEYLYRQAGPQWSFNYWAKRTKERRSQPYPDDLDDTFCSLAALYVYDPSIIDAGILADATKLLLATESSVGGPYRTWLVPDDSEQVWLDVDVAVNANVAYFLTLVGSPLPKLTGFLDHAISRDELDSSYYPSPHVPAYYIARGYNGRQEAILMTAIKKLLDGSDAPLNIALCVSSLLRLDPAARVDDAVTTLLDAQTADGAWPSAAFCLDPAIDGRAYYSGSPALTTALTLEALQLYSQTGQTATKNTAKRATGGQNPREAVLALADKQCRHLSPELQAALSRSLEMIANSKNGPEIIGLAGSFYKSLKKPPRRLEKDFMTRLGLANLYGWLAYTIYDDFLDGEGKPESISVANAALRRSLDNFSAALPADKLFAAFVRQVFDTIDGANAWELAHCRFKINSNQLAVRKLPDYGSLNKLAERSIGHVLPAVAILAAAGKKSDTAAAGHLLTAFRHYLIARQLNDDAHDWPRDLRSGHITPVVTTLLAELKIRPGEHPINDLLVAARPKFWHSTLLEVCRQMRRHIRLSRQALKRVDMLKPKNVMNDLLDGLEVSVTDTLRQQNQAKDFLKHYRRAAKKGTGI